MISKQEPSPYKGKTVTLVSGHSFTVEDWWININGKSWKISDGNQACMMYATRVAQQNLPMDDDVLYGRIDDDMKGLIHLSEIAPPKE